MKGSQSILVDQLIVQMHAGHGAATRRLLAACLAHVFAIGDTFALFNTINICNDVLRAQDDATQKMLDRKLFVWGASSQPAIGLHCAELPSTALVPCTPVWVEWLGEVLKKLLNCSLRH
jgi:hypothetical protein